MAKTAFLTFIYQQPDEFTHDFFKSLCNQTETNFDVIIVNDGYQKLGYFIEMYDKLKIIELDGLPSIVKNREIGINFVLNNGYEFLIFGDCDDSFSEHRVEVCLKYLKSFDVVVNDLTLFSDNGIIIEECYLAKRITPHTKIDANFIRHKNIFGFSNTSIKLKKIEKIVFPSMDLIAVDWFFFTKILKSGMHAKFTNECFTFYRQHENGLIGLNSFNSQKLDLEIETKIQHYRHFSDLRAEFDRVNILSRLDRNKLYKNILNKKINFPHWWEMLGEDMF